MIESNNKKNNTSYTEKYQNHIPCTFAYKAVCIDIDLANQLSFTEEKMGSLNSLKQFLKSMIKKAKNNKKAF